MTTNLAPRPKESPGPHTPRYPSRLRSNKSPVYWEECLNKQIFVRRFCNQEGYLRRSNNQITIVHQPVWPLSKRARSLWQPISPQDRKSPLDHPPQGTPHDCHPTSRRFIEKNASKKHLFGSRCCNREGYLRRPNHQITIVHQPVWPLSKRARSSWQPISPQDRNSPLDPHHRTCLNLAMGYLCEKMLQPGRIFEDTKLPNNYSSSIGVTSQ